MRLMHFTKRCSRIERRSREMSNTVISGRRIDRDIIFLRKKKKLLDNDLDKLCGLKVNLDCLESYARVESFVGE